MSEWPRLAVLLAVACLARPVLAVDAASAASDPAVEQRVKQLTVQLRCLVCQNESIAGYPPRGNRSTYLAEVSCPERRSTTVCSSTSQDCTPAM